jgi:hypothetical protein
MTNSKSRARRLSSLGALAALASIGAFTSRADAQLLVFNPGIVRTIAPTFACKKADKTPCTTTDLANPYYRQIVVIGAGYTSSDNALFWKHFDATIDALTTPNAGNVWSVQKRSQLLFVGDFVAGAPLGSDAAFGARTVPRADGRYGLSLRREDVVAEIDRLWQKNVHPMAVAVLFDTTAAGSVPATSSSRFASRYYGVSMFTAGDLAGSYVPTHELAHAALDFLDEYPEAGLEEQNVHALDVLAPQLKLDAAWGWWPASLDFAKAYPLQLSEILANNGNDNVATSPAPGLSSQSSYAYEGGLVFGRGVFHAPGANLMGSGAALRGPDDGFAWAHSASQQRVIDVAFGAPVTRFSDRIATVGPLTAWPSSWGSTTHVVLRDADKNHRFQPTRSYVVQVGWYARVWKTCWSASAVPYPCYDDSWQVAETVVSSEPRQVTLDVVNTGALAGQVRDALCAAGYRGTWAPTGATFCEVPVSALTSWGSPTVSLRTPYQDVEVPASQWQTTYWWRFRADNGGGPPYTPPSPFTGWQSFYRSL